LIDSSKKPKTLQARIVSGSIVLLSGSSLTTAINLAYNIAVARFLGPSGFGQAMAVYTLLTLISAVTLSYQMISAKLVAQESSAPDGGADAWRIHRSAWGCSLLIAFSLLVFQRQIAGYLNLPSSMLIVLLAIGAAFYVPLGSRRGLVQGAHGFRRLAANLVLEGIVRLGGSLLMVSLGFGVKGVIAANSAALAVAYFAVAPRRPAALSSPLRFGYVHREVAHALVFFSGQALINNCDIVLVKHFFSPTAAGLYAVVAMVGRVVFALCQAVVNSMVPIVAGTRAEERKNLSLISISLLLVVAIGSVLALGLRFTPSWVWTSLFGSGFLLPGRYGFPYLLALYAITTVIYSLSAVIITYEMSYKIANTSWVQLALSGFIVAGICRYHSSLQEVIVVQLILVSLLLLLVSLPFLNSALRKKRTTNETVSGSFRRIRRVSEDEVIAEFLKSDFGKAEYESYHERLHTIVYAPNLESVNESAKRRALLSLKHTALWKEIPSDTEWYEVELRETDLPQIRVFPRAQWRKIARGDFTITKVAGRMRSRRNSPSDPFVAKIASIRSSFLAGESNLGCVVLIGLNEAEPLAIIDGNHRFVAAVLEDQIHQLRFLCGLSPNMTQCCWYRTNLLTLTRYGRNLLRQLTRDPKAELAGLFESSV
jgi:O-antigen/teichoic acid export membrane protein